VTVPPPAPVFALARRVSFSPGWDPTGTIQLPVLETESLGSLLMGMLLRLAAMVVTPAVIEVCTPAVSDVHSRVPTKFHAALTSKLTSLPIFNCEGGSVQV